MSNYQCPKCKYASGDSWGQCRKDCPMPMSPYYRKETEEKYRAGIVQITGKLGKALSDAQMQAALGCGDIVAELGDGTISVLPHVIFLPFAS